METLDIEVENSKFVMPRDWRLFRSWWNDDTDIKKTMNKPDKWDPDLCIDEINKNEKFKHLIRTDINNIPIK